MENEVQGSKKCVAFLRQSRNQAPRRCVWNDATALLWKNRSSFAINEGADSFSSIARGRSALRPFCNATQIFNCELFSWETKSESQKIRKQKQKEEKQKNPKRWQQWNRLCCWKVLGETSLNNFQFAPRVKTLSKNKRNKTTQNAVYISHFLTKDQQEKAILQQGSGSPGRQPLAAEFSFLMLLPYRLLKRCERENTKGKVWWVSWLFVGKGNF